MEDAEDVDIAVVLDEVGDSIMPVKENAHVARRARVTVANFGKGGHILRPLMDALNGTGGRPEDYPTQ
jgi:hypothetical protein